MTKSIMKGTSQNNCPKLIIMFRHRGSFRNEFNYLVYIHVKSSMQDSVELNNFDKIKRICYFSKKSI